MASALLHGKPSDKPELAKAASPIEHVSKDAAPFCFIHGKADKIIPYTQSERMHQALVAMQSTSIPHAMVIGSDVPALQPLHLQSAAQALDANDVAVLPADDGGYVLIACKKTPAAPFRDMAWGTEHVMHQTRERCRTSALRLWEGEALWDVDRPEDVVRLRKEIPAPFSNPSIFLLKRNPDGRC